MQGYKSALVCYYSEHHLSLDPDMNAYIDEFMHGYKKTIADKKSRGVMSLKEGKSPISFSGYVEICKTLCQIHPIGKQHTWLEGVFGWTFMIFCWNLMGRSHSIGKIMLQHIDWRGIVS